MMTMSGQQYDDYEYDDHDEHRHHDEKQLHNLFQVYLKLQDEHNIPAADFPDVDVMREKLKK